MSFLYILHICRNVKIKKTKTSNLKPIGFLKAQAMSGNIINGLDAHKISTEVSLDQKRAFDTFSYNFILLIYNCSGFTP